MEVTMTTPDALGVIKSVSEALGDQIIMGVGTVLDTETCRMAILAGAKFVVTPVMKIEIIQMCHRYSVPIACGAYTPTEALAAHEAGADFVKIFPADTLGPGFMKAILAPLPMLRLIPTGGVDAGTAKSFLDAGCVAVAAGSSLVSKEILKNRDWAALTARAQALVKAVA
jgi:2-dehydro-3-deoxyphosphogluconate aldolase / (4S)-4-hydroxy-2-oxoglutarate aldolase